MVIEVVARVVIMVSLFLYLSAFNNIFLHVLITFPVTLHTVSLFLSVYLPLFSLCFPSLLSVSLFMH